MMREAARIETPSDVKEERKRWKIRSVISQMLRRTPSCLASMRGSASSSKSTSVADLFVVLDVEEDEDGTPHPPAA